MRGIGVKGRRKVTAPWEYLGLRKMEDVGRGAGRRAKAIPRKLIGKGITLKA